jgi:hypothetical protein
VPRRADLTIAVAAGHPARHRPLGAGQAGTPGWYAFVGGFFAWVWFVARRVADRRTHRGHGIHSTGRGAVADPSARRRELARRPDRCHDHRCEKCQASMTIGMIIGLRR